jgi:hypothetical protein
MQEKLDTVSLSELISIYNEISNMLKILEERENSFMESDDNA